MTDMREAAREAREFMKSPIYASDPDTAAMHIKRLTECLETALSHIGDGSKAEPVYQLKSKITGGWGDVSKVEYQHAHASYDRRIVYRQPAPTAQDNLPNEHGSNRYGLDMAYFRNLINRELNRPLVDFKPDEFARVCARMAATADRDVLKEPEFQAAQDSGKRFDPGTLGFLLEYIGQGDPEVIDGDEYEFLGETEEGLTGTSTHSITDLCRKAAEALRARDSKVPEYLLSLEAQKKLRTPSVSHANHYARGWNECRQAMLSATPVPAKPQPTPHNTLIFVGYTNGSQILYANDPNFGGEGQFYKDTAHNCVIPLYMLKTHGHRIESTTSGEVTIDTIKSLQRPEAPEGE